MMLTKVAENVIYMTAAICGKISEFVVVTFPYILTKR